MYKISPETKQIAKAHGLIIRPSSNPTKKIDVLFDDNIVSIGDIKYNDFHLYKKSKGLDYALRRRDLYHQRHKNDTKPAGILARLLLW
jgi:hypothetical protein